MSTFRDRYLFFIGCLVAVAFFTAFVSVSPAYAASIEVYGGGGGGGGGGGAAEGASSFMGLGGAGGTGGGTASSGFAGGNGSIDPGNIQSSGGGGGGGGQTGVGASPARSITGGAAGAGGDATAGGNGTALVAGARGGSGGNGSTGIATNDPANVTAAVDSISVIAGSGGNGGQGITHTLTGRFSGAGGTGGAGGGASLTLTAPTVTSGAIQVQSGANGLAGSGSGPDNGAGGAGGAASLTVQNTLIAPSITADKVNGALTISINTLDVSTIDTVLTATNTAATDFTITTANLSGGRLLSINNNAGDMTLGSLNVSGQGRLFVANGGSQAIGALNAQNADLTFVLPAGITAGQTIVAVNTANITGATIGVDDSNGRISMTPGQSVKLIAATAGITGSAANLTVQTANGDIFDLQVSGNDLLVILQQISPVNPAYERLKAFAEGRTATLAFVNQGQDLILNQGFGSALAATSGPGYQFAGFGGLSGGWSRYNTGSHVDVSGASLLTGIAVGNDLGAGRLTAGLFFEGGWGSYDSYNSFSNFASADGDGDTSYLGGGILGRYDVTTGVLSGLYFDASGRMGRAEMDFNTDDIKYNGSNADFDSSSMYYGAHAGLGYQWSFSEKAMLDLSGKFLWTRQEGDNVDVHGDKVRFDDADSLRTRLGGRFNYAVNDYITPYAGAYWEHEFDGKQRSSVNGIGIDAPELKGDTGVGELGLTVTPVADSGFSFDLGVQGYTGVREGVTGSVQLKFEF